MDFDNSPTLNRQTTTSTTGITATFSGAAQGGTSTPFGIVQPTIVVNYILRII
jgi:microcystin-dependent protein